MCILDVPMNHHVIGMSAFVDHCNTSTMFGAVVGTVVVTLFACTVVLGDDALSKITVQMPQPDTPVKVRVPSLY